VFEAFPGYRAGVVVAEGVSNGPPDAASDAALAGAAAGLAAADHPHLIAWRDAFRSFGAKRHLCSAEALISRALSGKGLPRISALVDRYNAVSVAHVVPVGGEDLSQVVPPVRLIFATGDEPFDDGGVRRGEVVWTDARGVTCRRWNWRQGVRTRLTETTTRAYFLFDALPPFSDGSLAAAMDALVASLRAGWPGAQLSSWVVREPTSTAH
jgi:DNA/RNA-binding domain of Phe-tRNA-synthetase-like protein